MRDPAEEADGLGAVTPLIPHASAGLLLGGNCPQLGEGPPDPVDLAVARQIDRDDINGERIGVAGRSQVHRVELTVATSTPPNPAAKGDRNYPARGAPKTAGARRGFRRLALVPTIFVMAYDEDLADRIRELLLGASNVTDQTMFGGLAFLASGNMAVPASGQGGSIVRVDPAKSDKVVVTTNARFVEVPTMPGWLRVGTEDVRLKRQLAEWVSLGMAYARSLPAKR